MHNEPMTKNEQAVLFNCILKNQIIIMNTLQNITLIDSKLKDLGIPEAIEKTRDVKRLVQYVEQW